MAATGSLPLPDKPSIVVLPFDNMSDDPEQVYFSDGITEDIITELSRFRSLFVIARNSSFTYKGTAVDVTEVGRALGVQYVVEGSVRKAGHRVRITTQLVEAESGNHLWAERYDRDLEDIFAVQDEVVRIVTSTLVGHVESDRLRRTKSLNSGQLAAYDYVLQARDHLFNFTSADIRTAAELLEKAITANPSYADAHALLAMSHAWAFEGWWADEPENSLELAFQVANGAVRIDSNSGQAQSALAYAYLYKRQHDQAIHHFKRALALLPCDSTIMLNYGMCLAFAGDPDAGLEFIAAGERIDPLLNLAGPWVRGIAHYSARRYQDAITALREIPDPPVEVHGWLAACHAQLGQPEEARAAIDKHEARARREFPDFPGDTPGGWARYWWWMVPYRDDDDLEHVLEGLRKAGLRV
jgi:TolB-like protein/Tfp pilus assembly protein PilF